MEEQIKLTIKYRLTYPIFNLCKIKSGSAFVGVECLPMVCSLSHNFCSRYARSQSRTLKTRMIT